MKNRKYLIMALVLTSGVLLNLNYAKALLDETPSAAFEFSPPEDCKDFETPGTGTARVRRCVVDLQAYCDFENLGLPASDGKCTIEPE
jgi:hypothetical protein